MSFTKAETFRLGNAVSGWGESFVQELIADDPAILGLGDLVMKDKERRHEGAGRLDFLLQDSPVKNRYAVEVQLGDTNPSHIVRTIEYWDRERRRYPQFEHFAVIVAEGINARFFNVIGLFNQHIPIIAIKMTAIQVGQQRSLLFTKILDYATQATDDDDEAGLPETNRDYWLEKSSPQVMTVVDGLIRIAKEVDSTIGPKYNKGSIPLKKGGDFFRFLTLWPKKKHLKMALPCAQSSDIELELDGADIDFDDYDEVRSRYVLTLTPADLPKNAALLSTLIKRIGSQNLDLNNVSADI